MTWPPAYLDLQSGRLMDGLWRLLLPGRLYTEEPSRLIPLPCRYGATFSESARICVRACVRVSLCVCVVDCVCESPDHSRGTWVSLPSQQMGFSVVFCLLF